MAEAGAEHYFRFEAGTEIAENSRHCDHRRRSLGARGSDEPRAFERAEDLLNSKRRRSVSCLIADVQMPGMTGLELHDRLVTLGKPIPTILITAFHNESVRQRALQAGVVGYLTKPFSEEDLLACIRSILGRSEAGR